MSAGKPLLHLLLHANHPVAIGELARQAGLPVKAAREQLLRLADAECLFDHHPQQGYRLRAAGLGAWVDYLHWRDGHDRRKIELYRQTASTQDAARRLAEQHGAAAQGGLAVADEQTAGRGRLGRRWIAAPGEALTFSYIDIGHNPSIDRLTLATAVAVATAIEAATANALSVAVKWPNDIYANDRKLAGILVETFPLGNGSIASIIGVGVNVSLHPPHNDPELRRAISLRVLGYDIDRLRLLAELVPAMDDALNQQSVQSLVTQWRQRSVLLGRQVRLQTDGRVIEGQVIDLDPQQGLIVRTLAGELLHLPAQKTTVWE